MNALLVSVLVLLVAPQQAPSTRANPASVHDTLRLMVQPPPTVNIEAPSQVPTVVFGVVGALLLAGQLWIMARQTTAMNRQTALLDQQAVWRRDEAVGSFYRMAFDLVEEFAKANVACGRPIPANPETHPRQVLREASRVFAPLGNAAVMAVNAVGLRLDDYFRAVQSYNNALSPADVLAAAEREPYNSVQSFRGIIGNDLDLANHQIPEGVRWKYGDGTEYKFRVLCSKPTKGRESVTQVSTP